MRLQIVHVVFAQFLQRGASNIEQLELHLGRSRAVGQALYDILLAASGRLHHLIDCAVAMCRQEAGTKPNRKLIEDFALFIEKKVVPVGLRAKDSRDRGHIREIFRGFRGASDSRKTSASR